MPFGGVGAHITRFYDQIVFILPVKRRRYEDAIGSLIKANSRYTRVRRSKVEHALKSFLIYLYLLYKEVKFVRM